MLFIEGGSYSPLFNDKLDNKDIVVESFFIDEKPVTNLEYKNFLYYNSSWSKKNVKDFFVDSGYLNHWHENDISLIKNLPVVNISWFSAQAYCESLNLELPSIDQWEYISSISDNNSLFDWYQYGEENLKDFNEKKPNNLGLVYFNESIWEWVLDFNSVILINTDTEGGGLEEILYCGAVAANSINPKDYFAFMRYAFRSSLEANYTMNKLGFRCVKNE